MELRREVARAQRTKEPLVVAFIDVNGLKAVNDTGGHARGDAVLRTVANAVRANLRPYDLIVRYGGDEFICGLYGLDMPEATNRLAAVNVALAGGQEQTSVTIGLAELQADDTLETLVDRADAALYQQRRYRVAGGTALRRRDALDEACRDAGLSPIELWFRYFELGGLAAPLELEAYLQGALQPSRHEHDLILYALDRPFAELGQAHPVR